MHDRAVILMNTIDDMVARQAHLSLLASVFLFSFVSKSEFWNDSSASASTFAFLSIWSVMMLGTSGKGMAGKSISSSPAAPAWTRAPLFRRPSQLECQSLLLAMNVAVSDRELSAKL